MPLPKAGDLSDSTLEAVRKVRSDFHAVLEPFRPKLYGYCRRLTGNVWDAEDLVQETLSRAFAFAAQSHRSIEHPMAWLARIATNAYLDAHRRTLPLADLPAAPGETSAPAVIDPMEVREALGEVSRMLSPQERACVVLKDVFDLPLKEIAAMLATSEGAVKAALHRGRGRLAQAPAGHRHGGPSRAVLDQLAEAFSAYDVERLAQLFMADAVSEVVGMVHEIGREQIRAGSLHHTFHLETDVRYRAEVRELDGEDLVLLWARPTDGTAGEALADLLRVQTVDGLIAQLKWYFFCPETLTEVAEQLGVPVHTHGYHY